MTSVAGIIWSAELMVCKLLTNDRCELLFKLMKAQSAEHQIVNLNTELLRVPLIVLDL
jgi:hypothetical protein